MDANKDHNPVDGLTNKRARSARKKIESDGAFTVDRAKPAPAEVPATSQVEELVELVSYTPEPRPERIQMELDAQQAFLEGVAETIPHPPTATD